MKIGVPKEIKQSEYRVGLTPAAAGDYIQRGHEVVVETGAGAGIGATDETYRAVGAEIAATAAEVWGAGDMIVKVKEPQSAEYPLMRDGQILYTYLHLAADRALTEALMTSGTAAIAYETVTDDEGHLPLLAPMSEVAGRLSIQAAATALQRPNGGSGVLLGGVPGVAPGRVVIIGGGVVGTQAARMAVGLGARVTILDKSVKRMQELDEMFQGRVVTQYSTRDALVEELKTADAVIGAVLIPGASAPKLVTRDMLKLMKPRSVVVDVAIDQGGCFETSRPTTHDDPTYEVDGIVHYCVANMPGAVAQTSSHALNHATLPYGLKLADRGLAAVAADPHLERGLNVFEGGVTFPGVAESLGLPLARFRGLAAA